jgi:outer membrane autotransporter protein
MTYLQGGTDMKQPGLFAMPVHVLINVGGRCFSALVPVMAVFILLVCVAVTATWSSPGLAQQTIVGATPTELDQTGEEEGVEMTGQGGGGALLVGPAFSDIFTNNTLVDGVSAIDSTLPAVSTDVASLSDIVFRIDSTVYGTIGDGAIFNNIAVIDGVTVNFLGTVFTTTMNVGTGGVNINSGTGTNVGAVTFTGDGTVSLAPNTGWTGALNAAGAETGTLVLGSASQWNGAVGAAGGLKFIEVVGDGVSATITGQVDAFTFNLGSNTLLIDGLLNVLNPGTVTPTINTTLASDTVFGNITKLSGATNFSGSVAVNVFVPESAVLLPGTFFTIVDSESGTSDEPVTVTIQSSTNPLYTFEAVPDTTLTGSITLQLTGVPLTAVDDPIVDVILDEVQALPGLGPVVAGIGTLTDPAAIALALKQLAPSTPSLAAPQVTFDRSRQFQDLWLYRLDICPRHSNQYYEKNPDACRDSDPRRGWWLRGFGYAGEQNVRRDSLGYDSHIAGGMMGYDVPLGPDTRAGLSIGFARSTMDGKTHDTEMEFDSLQATAYIGHERGPWFIQGAASFAWNEYSDRRRMVFPGVDETATADYSGQDYTVYVRAGHRFFFPVEEVTITPNASLRYSRVDLDGYTEKDAGDLNLKVGSQSYDFAESGLGVMADRVFSSFSDGKAVVPEVHFNWFHRFSNPTPKQTSRFDSGTRLTITQGQDMARDTFNVGTRLTLLSCGACNATAWSLDAGYDYYWTSDGFSAHQGNLRFSARF